jgi:3-oxoadipate enol-lactonase
MSPRTVLVYAGICDTRMWDGFALPGKVLRHSLADDLAQTVGEAPAALVGASYGGLVCLEFAARRPELVTRLVLLDAPLMDHEWSEEIEEYDAEEQRLLDAGDLDGAAELDIRFWAPEIGERLRPMARHALEMDVREVGPVDLGAVPAPALVAVGENDKRDFREIAERLARELPSAELAVIPGAGHLPSMERPEATLRVVKPFLERNHKL